MAKITFTMLDEETAEVEVELPAKYQVCGRCDGEGKHVNPSIDSHGISREEFDEDPDFEEAYFRGDYDVQCEECGGRTTVLVVDEAACRVQGLEKELKAYYQDQRDAAEMDAICAAERRMGA
jgi:RecJ-like exonuclease